MVPMYRTFSGLIVLTLMLASALLIIGDIIVSHLPQ
jgi:hypothetical protein